MNRQRMYSNRFGAQRHLGATDPSVVVVNPATFTISPTWVVIDTLSMVASTYHGYKRNQNGDHPIAWALTWGLLGTLFPVVTPVIAVAQGFGKPLPR